jgi:uncharacterized protein YyaL (SSP411 family)
VNRNNLDRETSPYLLQHRDNPVHWQPWGQAALDEAKKSGKPILLSVGYAACHWCHVMAHESFENPETAALMNERFVNIKVDREERPDLDAIYQHALMLLGEQGGWPLTMFLTQAGEPFWGGTYFPPDSRWGRPAFADVLKGVSQIYAHDRAKVQNNVESLRAALRKLAAPVSGGAIPEDTGLRVAEGLLRAVDLVHGGIGEAPKFPQAPLLDLLWRGWKRSRNEAMRGAVTLTLDNICQGGIYDHAGGGFARYSTDARWLAPHFEKMLYDNALLVRLLTEAWKDTRKPLYAARVAETVRWLEREMLLPEGGFCSSLDADSEHQEGKFYVWSESQIDAALGPRAPDFKRAYGVTQAGNWEGHNILNRLGNMEFGEAETEAALARDLAVLLAMRGKRVRPGLDDKALADWNGMMISALAEASCVFSRPEWLDLAKRAFDFVARRMTAPDGSLFHSFRAGQAKNAGLLDDYAQMIGAALALHEATGEDSFLVQARTWEKICRARHWDENAGGYFTASVDAEALILRAKQAQDGPSPSGNGTMAANLARLFYFTGEDSYRALAEKLFAAFSGEIERNPFGHATLLAARELLAHALQIVILGERGNKNAEALLRVVFETSLPNRVLAVVAPGRKLAANHPAYGKSREGGQEDGVPTAYLCEGPTCSLPIVKPGDLAASLTRR